MSEDCPSKSCEREFCADGIPPTLPSDAGATDAVATDAASVDTGAPDGQADAEPDASTQDAAADATETDAALDSAAHDGAPDAAPTDAGPQCPAAPPTCGSPTTAQHCGACGRSCGVKRCLVPDAGPPACEPQGFPAGPSGGAISWPIGALGNKLAVSTWGTGDRALVVVDINPAGVPVGAPSEVGRVPHSPVNYARAEALTLDGIYALVGSNSAEGDIWQYPLAGDAGSLAYEAEGKAFEVYNFGEYPAWVERKDETYGLARAQHDGGISRINLGEDVEPTAASDGVSFATLTTRGQGTQVVLRSLATGQGIGSPWTDSASADVVAAVSGRKVYIALIGASGAREVTELDFAAAPPAKRVIANLPPNLEVQALGVDGGWVYGTLIGRPATNVQELWKWPATCNTPAVLLSRAGPSNNIFAKGFSRRRIVVVGDMVYFGSESENIYYVPK